LDCEENAGVSRLGAVGQGEQEGSGNSFELVFDLFNAPVLQKLKPTTAVVCSLHIYYYKRSEYFLMEKEQEGEKNKAYI
jgi:hypothetical protein